MSKIRRTNKNAIKFDGVADYIEIPIGPGRSKLSFGQDVVNAAEPESPFSVSFWFHTPDVAGSGDDAGHFVGIVNRDTASATHAQHEWLLFRSGNKVQFFLYDPENDSGDPDQSGTAVGTKYRFGNDDALRGLGARIIKESVATLQDNTWHNIVATYDGSKTEEGQKIYIDGTLIGVAFSEKSDNPQVGNAVADQFPYEGLRNGSVPLTIGAFFTGGVSVLGSMADVCIFDKALSLAEVGEVYNGGKVKNMTKASTYDNLLGWWKMGDDEDTTGPAGIKDYINSNHGELKGDAYIAEDLRLGTDIEPNPATANIHTHQSFGKTRGPKSPLQYTQNLVGNSNYIIPYTTAHAGNSVWDIANIRKDYGLATENQRYMHLLIDSTTIPADAAARTASVGVLGYINAFGVWTQLIKMDLPSNEPQNANSHQVLLTGLQDNARKYMIFDILGVDKVMFFATNPNASEQNTWQLRVAFSSF